ncbi:MAG: hypothetical protein NTX96_01765 [Candidatus Zambryskibacteria bacterium]|nr:hypothetical protein [Candidatus Zambryskibacteria bacterium]
MKKIILNTLIAILVFGGGMVLAETETNATAGGTVCAQDAKQCSDGSYVARIGPNCEFAKCPNLTSTSTKPKQGLLQGIKNFLQNKKENSVVNKEEIKNKIQEKIASSTEKKIEGRFEKMTKKYLETIEREEKIMAKIESRITKIKLAGGNTVEAEQLVIEAKTQLAGARADYETLKTTATTVDSVATTTKAALASMKDIVKLIDKHLRDAHKALQKTVGSLRGVSQLRNASSTKEN